jgi:hypothetical protein
VGDFFDLVEFRPISSQKLADLGKIRPNWQNFARKFLGQNFPARIRPFQTSFAQNKITVYVSHRIATEILDPWPKSPGIWPR